MSRRRVLLAVAAGLLWLAGLAATPLFESTEGRYGSVAAEMRRGGDWLEPHFNGLVHLTKPPLAYWAGALGLTLLPDGEFALRLPATLAWLAGALLLYPLALDLGLDRRRARWAAWLGGTAPLAMVQGHMLSSDVFLALGVILAYRGVLSAGPGWRRALWTGAGLAVGLLAKGHMVLFWCWLPLAVGLPLAREPRRLLTLAHPLTWLLLLGLGLPWFVAEILRHPGLLHYWIWGETEQRYLSTAHGRAEPWWYFLALTPAALLPWLPEAARGLWRGLRDRRRATLVAWALLPLLLLSLSGSKRPNYLLPLVPPLALMAAAALPEGALRGLRWRTGLWVGLAILAPLVLGLRSDWTPPTRALVRAAKAEGGPLVAYRVMPTALSYYWGSPVPVLEREPTGPFDSPAALARWAPTDPIVLTAALEAGGAVLASSGDDQALERATGIALRPRARAGRLALWCREVPGGAP